MSNSHWLGGHQMNPSPALDTDKENPDEALWSSALPIALQIFSRTAPHNIGQANCAKAVATIALTRWHHTAALSDGENGREAARRCYSGLAEVNFGLSSPMPCGVPRSLSALCDDPHLQYRV